MIFTSYKKIDDVGRVVLSKDIRRELDLRTNDMLKIDVEDGRIVISKAEQTCVFCGKTQDLKSFKGKTVCAACISQLIS